MCGPPGKGTRLLGIFIVEHLSPTEPGDARVPAVIAALERELAILDQIGAHIAGAYLDAAIDQLRREQARR